MKRFYVCRRLRLYNYLVQAGYKPVEHRVDKLNPDYLVWIFENSDALQEIITEYYNREY